MYEYKFYGKVKFELEVENEEEEYFDCVDEELYSNEYFEDYYMETLDNKEALKYFNVCKEAFEKEIELAELPKNNGFMEYFSCTDKMIENSINKKVKSAFLDLVIIDKEIYSEMTVKSKKELTDKEINTLKDEFIGQYSDGFGESFEQRAIKTKQGDLYVKLYQHNKNQTFELQTEELMFPNNNEMYQKF